jgi:hypothetical protein
MQKRKTKKILKIKRNTNIIKKKDRKMLIYSQEYFGLNELLFHG